MALPEASVSSMNGRLKLGKARMGAVVMAVFRESKVDWDSELHWKASLHSNLVKGVVKPAYPLTNFR